MSQAANLAHLMDDFFAGAEDGLDISDGLSINPKFRPGEPAKVALLGAGNLCGYFAAVCKAYGWKVSLWTDPAHATSFNIMRDAGKIRVAGKIATLGQSGFQVDFCDTLEEALAGANIVIPTLPADALPDLFRQMASTFSGPLAHEPTVFEYLVLTPASLKSLAARQIFGPDHPVHIIELMSASITAKFNRQDNIANLKAIKKTFEYATLEDRPDRLDLINRLFFNDSIVKMDMLSLFLNSPGSRLHQLCASSGYHDLQTHFPDPNARFYRDVIGSEATGVELIEYDAAMNEVATVYGREAGYVPLVAYLNRTYPNNPPFQNRPYASVTDWARSNGPQNATHMMPDPEPSRLVSHRFVTEDGLQSCIHERLANLPGANVSEGSKQVLTATVNNINRNTRTDIRATVPWADYGLTDGQTMGGFLAQFE